MNSLKNLMFPLLVLGVVSCKKSPREEDAQRAPNQKTFAEVIQSNTSLIKSIDYDTLVQLSAGLEQSHLKYTTPANQVMDLHILRVDLNKDNLGIQVATPGNSNSFALQTVMNICMAGDTPGNQILAAVNADYFLWTGEPWGPVVRQGNVLKSSFREQWHSFFGIDKNNKPVIGDVPYFAVVSTSLKEAIGGTERLVRNGSMVSHSDEARHPRTFVGYTAAGLVFIVVADGRQSTHSIGLTLAEMSSIMYALGAREAINLDGGGSTTLVNRKIGIAGFEIKNKPSDNPPRAVANALAVFQY